MPNRQVSLSVLAHIDITLDLLSSRGERLAIIISVVAEAWLILDWLLTPADFMFWLGVLEFDGERLGVCINVGSWLFLLYSDVWYHSILTTEGSRYDADLLVDSSFIVFQVKIICVFIVIIKLLL